MAQGAVKKLDFVLVSSEKTHPPIDMEDDTLPYPCQSIGRLSRLCSLSAHTRSRRFKSDKNANVSGITLCCFNC